MIHKSAIVDPSAKIDDSTEIGPFTVIGADVEIGPDNIIGPHVTINGPTKIGCGNHIYQYASVGEDPQDKKYANERTRLEIGDRNVIREFTTIHRGTTQDQSLTKIGHDNLLMAYAHVAHDCMLGDDIILANAASLGGHVHIDSHVILGGFSIVHQFCHIGAFCFSAMGSAISRDVPPYVMVGGRPTEPHGINSVGLERRGFSKESIRNIKRAYKLLYKSRLTLKDAVAAIEEMGESAPEVRIMANFIHQATRSIIR